MTSQISGTSLPLPLSALLAPGTDAPADALPTPLALLGPLPPTTPIHLALNYLYLSSIPDFTSKPNDNDAGPSRRSRDRVLVITGPREEYGNSVEVDDEDYIRERGGDYTILDRLRRVDIRYCPSVKHAMLLLSLLSQAEGKGKGKETGPQILGSRPGLVILWNLSRLLMEIQEPDENVQLPNEGQKGPRAADPETRFKKEIVISDYLETIAAAKSAVDHLSSTGSPTSPRTSLMVLEPDITPDASLPIFPPGQSGEGVPKNSREKRIKLQTGLERILGQGCFGGIRPAHVDDQGGAYTLSLSRYPDQGFSIRRRHCPRAEYGSARQEVDIDGLPIPEGDPGGWRWEWA